MLKKGDQIHNFILCQLFWFHFITVQEPCWGPLLNYGSGSAKVKSYRSYGSGYATLFDEV